MLLMSRYVYMRVTSLCVTWAQHDMHMLTCRILSAAMLCACVRVCAPLQGVVYEGREDLTPDNYLTEVAVNTTKRTLQEAIDGADVFLGLSVRHNAAVFDGAIMHHCPTC